MFKVILLICAVSVQQPDCNIHNAVDVIYGPDADNEITCGMQSQAFLAGTAIGRNLTQEHYAKIRCVRSGIGNNNVG